jgi:hypothetical protein
VRGHPQRAMLMAHHLWELTPPRAAADTKTWQQATVAAMRELQETFERSWESLSVNERRALAAAAWTGPWGAGDSFYSQSTLARFRLNKSTARTVSRQLLRAGELFETDAGRLQLVDPLMEAWIASGRRPPSLS